ncbi:tautomerase family protein [Caldimonas brevitalea]|uniref:4-oxalocrotonate tautomerase n=1 Tax=Caldimonas brevitalea TaxID=413882 RepID=A0A0G3BHE0_9BURK|nr:hypothetical protein [Caldimonas brevitalea]AKJ26761.1 4-oxalocrotonate tautomerase [Caldimonas brevitalea]
MPFLHLRVCRPSPEGPLPSDRLTSRLVALTAEHLHKQPELTAVQIDEVEPQAWSIGGVALSRQHCSSFQLRISITEGTNTKDEKARYIAAVFAGLHDELGNLHPVSYVLIDEPAADAYGYGGLTQEHRYVAARLAVSSVSQRGSERALSPPTAAAR